VCKQTKKDMKLEGLHRREITLLNVPQGLSENEILSHLYKYGKVLRIEIPPLHYHYEGTNSSKIASMLKAKTLSTSIHSLLKHPDILTPNYDSLSKEVHLIKNYIDAYQAYNNIKYTYKHAGNHEQYQEIINLLVNKENKDKCPESERKNPGYCFAVYSHSVYLIIQDEARKVIIDQARAPLGNNHLAVTLRNWMTPDDLNGKTLADLLNAPPIIVQAKTVLENAFRELQIYERNIFTILVFYSHSPAKIISVTLSRHSGGTPITIPIWRKG
jgi:hypothetical protein